jgi:hypothetical protein
MRLCGEEKRPARNQEGGMMKKLLLLLFVVSLPLPAEKIGEIREALKGPRLTVGSDRFYIINGVSPFVRIYSLKGCRPIGQFGRQGQGPGEVATLDSELLDMYGSSLMIADFSNKLLFFSPDGVLQREMKIPQSDPSASALPPSFPLIYSYKQFSGNFVCKATDMLLKEKCREKSFVILDPQLRAIKKVASQKEETVVNVNGNSMSGHLANMDYFRDCFDWQIWRDKLFIGDTRKGFYLAVYDKLGTLLYEIKRPYEKLPVTAADKNEARARIRNEYVNRTTFPEFFPAFEKFLVADGRIYVFTYKRQGGAGEVLALDLKGNLLKSAFIPTSNNYAVSQGVFYYLRDNEEKECWELHAERMF